MNALVLRRFGLPVLIGFGLAESILSAHASHLEINQGILFTAGTIVCDHIYVGPDGTLAGTGVILGNLLADGSVAPGRTDGVAGTLGVDGAVSFADGSALRCNAVGNTSIDSLDATGAITGSTQIEISPAAGVVILDEAVASGGVGSDYSAFTALGGSSLWTINVAGTTLAMTDMVGTSDDDIMPDWWEIEYFGGRTNAVALADSDADGANNEAEYIAGTHPHDDASLLEIISLSLNESNHCNIVWTSVSNRVYDVERSDSPSWDGITSVTNDMPGVAPSNRFTDPSATGAVGVYRIRVKLP